MLYFASTPWACVTQAAEGAVSRIDSPAMASCISPVRKKNVRFLITGPPSENPGWLLRISCGRLPFGNVGDADARSSFRLKKYTVPCSALVPDLITIFTFDPALRPVSAPALVCTEN